MKIELAIQKLCPLQRQGHGLEEPYYCDGRNCMMWEADLKSEVNFDNESQEPPEGDGWVCMSKHKITHGERKGTTLTNWKRTVEDDTGDCGLKSKYLECNQ